MIYCEHVLSQSKETGWQWIFYDICSVNYLKYKPKQAETVMKSITGTWITGIMDTMFYMYGDLHVK